MLKKTKSSPLIKTLLKGNAKRLLLIFVGSLFVVFFDSIDVMYYNQVVNNLDTNTEEPNMSLLTSMILLLVNYFLYTITFRSIEAYTEIFSFKLISQLDALIYDKLLRISPYNNISEGSLVNFIQNDAENFGEFFTYTPATLVQPLQIIYFMYLLFTYFGFVFIFSIITLVIIFIVFGKLQKIKAKYKKEILNKKDRRMATTTQAFEMITIVKLYSWEDYFLKKISQEREEELIYIKKAQIVSLFIDSITWSIGPILSFVSVFSYNLFNEPMTLPNLLTSLYIFHNLTDPLFLIPEYINGLIDSLLSIKRLEAFLFSKEYVPSQMENKYDNFIKNKKEKNKENDKNENKNIEKERRKEIENNITNDRDDIKLKVLDDYINHNNNVENNHQENSHKDNNNETKNDIKSEEDKEKNKNIENDIMIEIDNIDFGIIKKEEEFVVIEEKDDDDDDSDDDEDEKEKVEEEKGEKDEEKKTNQEIIKGTVTVPLLKGINLKVKRGDLIGIIGEFGSGKSCLFNAILNNLDILNDKNKNKKIILNGSVAYVPQKPWILNDTVRNNIIFNKPYDEEKYNKVVQICQLEPDFELLKEGDFTIISDKGDNLSGGQKTRITIARAAYTDADIYLFDDPFSSLDAYVGKKIFEKTIKEYLKGKTILVITHFLQYIPKMDYVIKMNEGEIVYYGNVQDTEKQNFYKDFVSSNQSENFEKTVNNHYNILKNKKLNNIVNEYNESDKSISSVKNIKKDPLLITKQDKYSYHKPTKIEILKIVFSYSGGCFVLFGILFLNGLWKLSDSGSDFIITNWSTAEFGNEPSLFTYYFLIKIVSIIFVFVKSYAIVYALISYNRNMHETLLHRLLRAPVNLFHNIVAKSHIINRFSKDIGNSEKYFWSLNSTLVVLFHIMNGIIISVFFFWKIMFIIPFLLFLDYFLYNYYIKCAKGLNVLEIYTRVPILSGVKETLSGITSIRAYGFKNVFQYLYHKKLYNFYRVLVYQVGTSSWFALYIDLVSFCFLVIILIFIWVFKNKIGGGPLGITLNYVMKLIEHYYNFFSYLNKNERMSTSMESCDAYTHIVQEAPLKLESDELLIKDNFPKSGKVQFINYSVRYRPDTKIILKDINILIQPGEKIGIVGRTGSGKSTLCLCLFRILEATSGQILIDDIDISLIGLSLLRRIITVIPQDPTLIEGSLRENLDPSGKYDDQNMIESLKSIGMDYILEKEGLNFMVKENGDNLSQGERQLVCIARALIRKSKIIIMDEATASIDYEAEQLIQKAILTNLKDSTVMTIAHRIKTILDYDRILVFDQGKLIQQGTPKELIEKKEGHFFNLYSESHV